MQHPKGLRIRDGRWHWRMWINGHEYSQATDLAATKQNVKAALALRAKERERIMQPRQKTEDKPFNQAAGEFISWCHSVEYRAKPNTARRLQTSFVSLVTFFEGRSVSSILAGDVEKYKQWRLTQHRVHDVTLRKDLFALSIFFKRYAKKFRWCTSNPVDEVSKPSDRDSFVIRVLTADEEARYFDAARELGFKNLHDLGRIMILQGCRPEEILSLRKEDFTATGIDGVIQIRGGKTRAATRKLTLTGEAQTILEARFAQPSTWFFPSPRYEGRHMTKLNNQHDRACHEAGVAFRLYDLRHTFATRLAQSGCDLPTLAAILGHSGLRMVMRYVHPTEQHQKEAIKKYEAAIRPQLKVVGK